jgi:hypothetical protein
MDDCLSKLNPTAMQTRPDSTSIDTRAKKNRSDRPGRLICLSPPHRSCCVDHNIGSIKPCLISVNAETSESTRLQGQNASTRIERTKRTKGTHLSNAG